MKKQIKCVTNKDGFTLVELMIVLSIIAILAIVLVPKVGDMKDSVREQGVNSNLNSIRAFLELKVNSRLPNANDEDDRMLALLQTEFIGGNAIVNPFTNGDNIGLDAWNTLNNNNYSTIIYNRAIMFDSNNYTQLGTNISYRGKIIIEVFNNVYIIYGMNKEGVALTYQIVR